MATVFDELSATTRASIEQDVVQDNLLVDPGLQKVVHYYANESEFTGGLWDQVPFIFDRPDGGASRPGDTYEVKEKQLLAAFAFQPRQYTIPIPINEWKNEVINTGPNAAVSIYDTYLEMAVRAFNTEWNLDAYQHGQQSSATVGQARIYAVNGMDEFLNNGIDPGWMSNIYTTIGGETRNGTVGVALNSTPMWCGGTDGSLGQVNYGSILDGYLRCIQSPDTLLCNRELFRLILMRQEPKQRFIEAKDLRVGISGVSILDAFIHLDILAPSTKFGGLLSSKLHPGGSLIPADITAAATASVTALSGYPTATACHVGEPLFILRLKDWKLRPVASGRYRHHFEGPIASAEAPDLKVMYYQEGLNWYTPSPRDNLLQVGYGT